MKSISRTSVWAAILFLLGSLGTRAQGPQTHPDSLFAGFQNPPSEYDLIPLWTWNGKIDAQEGKHQIDEMIAKGVNRAIVYPFPNLRVRFLSEDWWKLWGELLAYARAKHFQLGVNAENEWPDGEARDHWLDPPDQSHTLEGHPEYHMKHLAYVEREFLGPGTLRFNDLPNPVIAVAARIQGPDAIDGDSLVDLSQGLSGSNFAGELPQGNWRLMFFYLENTTGTAQGGRIDVLNPAAVARFIDLTLGEYYRRFHEYFGSTFTFVLLDHEGDYGNSIAWTPALFDQFQSSKGYDLRKYLPLLVYDGGKQTPKVRVDYLRTISDLYAKNYWGQIARWSEVHGLQMTGQGDSETLLYDASRGGDYMQMMRAMTMPGVEETGHAGRSPREFMEDESIADYEGRRYWCEGPLVLAAQTYLSPQKERYDTNMLALWGIDLLSPQFYVDVDAMSYPPDDFISQPWWKYFRHYTDYARRLMYMNGGGKHVVDLLMYRPTDTVFTYANPLFKQGVGYSGRPIPDSTATPPSTTSEIRDSGHEYRAFGMPYYPRIVWKNNYAATVETAYFDLMETLTGYQRAYDIADDYYLPQMKLENGALTLAGLSFRGIILPPMKVISRMALSRIRQFYDAGGLVVAYGALPSASSEKGWDDPGIAADVRAIFGVDPGGNVDAENHNAQGGKAYFVVGNVERVLAPLDRNLPADLQVISGPRDRLLYLHRVKDGQNFYWIVNDTDQPRQVVVSLAAQGKPELWDPATGERHEKAYWVREGRTVVPLQFHAWDATYVVFNSSKGEPPEASVAGTNLEGYKVQRTPSGGMEAQGRVAGNVKQIYLEGEAAGKKFRMEEVNQAPLEPQVLSFESWHFKPEANELAVKYAREKVVATGEGLAAGFELPDYNDQVWDLSALSAERETIRNWWVVGPFPNPNHGEGYNTAYPPEQKIDLGAMYKVANGAEVGWRHYQSTRPETDLSNAVGASTAESVVAYATTWVYSPREQQVRAIVVGKNVKLWLNGRPVFARYTEPLYFELRDPFGYDNSVEFKAGWNQFLVKITGSERGRALCFYLRLADSQGSPLEGLITSWEPSDAAVSEKTQAAKARSAKLERWYRAQVPVGVTALLLPPRPSVQAVYLNGRELKPAGGQVQFPALDFREPCVLALRVEGTDELVDFLRFKVGETTYHLGSWTGTGLTYYAGSASYEKEFDLAPALQGKEVWLDCGEVGVTEETWLNGQKVGERLWAPFSLDVSKYLKPGRNHLRLVVTNASDAALRSVPDFKRYLELEDLSKVFLDYAPPYADSIDLNGLMGPVRLVPYKHVQLSTSSSAK